MRDYTAFIQEEIAAVTGIHQATLDLETPFSGFGIDSLQAVNIASNIGKKLDRELPLTVFFDYPTIRQLADYLSGKFDTSTKLSPIESTAIHEPIAIIGLACRFPGADNAETFWKNLVAGVDCIREVPSDRWDYRKYSELPALRWGGFLSEINCFDSEMFSTPNSEAERMDPQQKLLLECVHEAIECAGFSFSQLQRSNTGVFIGISSSDFSANKIRAGEKATVLDAIGNSHSIASNRISYLFNWRGPCLSVDTACSSSLVALHKACQSIEAGECDLAIVGGVNVLLDPQISIAFAEAGMLAPDGRCKTFSQEANGYVRGEGVGIIVLQRAAVAKQERIYALVRGTAINHDGKTNGLTAPSGPAQEEVIRRALSQANIEAEKIDFIEAHGTGTSLGDPIEFSALARVFPFQGTREEKLHVGSAKSFIGHLEAAAGIAGVIKAALSLKNRLWVKQIQYTSINPKMSNALKDLSVITDHISLPSDRSTFVGISSFGFGGTNAHALLEGLSAPAIHPFHETEGNLFLSFSATNLESLKKSAQVWKEKLPSLSRAAIQRSVQERLENRVRVAFYGRDQKEISSAIEQWQFGKASASIQRDLGKNYRGRLAFSFLSKDPSLITLAYQLSEEEKGFAEYWLECLAYFDGYFSYPLKNLIPDEMFSTSTSFEPLLFSARYSIAKYLEKNFDLQAELIIANGLSEIAAQAVTGQISLPEACKYILQRNTNSIEVSHSNSQIVSVLEDESKEELFLKLDKDGINTILDFGELFVEGGKQVVLPLSLAQDSSCWQKTLCELALRKFLYLKRKLSDQSLPTTAFFHKNTSSRNPQEPNMEKALLAELQILVAGLLHLKPEEVDPDTNLIDLGADSLLLLSAIQTIKERHGVTIAVADLFRNLNTLRAICNYVVEHKPKTPTPAPTPEFDTRKIVAAMNTEAAKSTIRFRGDLQGIIETQLSIMHSQLQLLGGHAVDSPSIDGIPIVQPTTATVPAPQPEISKVTVEAKGVLGNWRAKANREVSAEEKAKEKYIKEFISRFNQKTPKTKEHTQKYRRFLADNRVSAGFRPNIKEMIYTIIFESGKGSHFRDLDGNDFIDFTMGFGVNLFGHCPEFIEKRIRQQFEIGYCVGPQAELAGIVAEKACKVVQHERIAFLNSGTEAVMTAIRLARAVTKRNRVVIFEGSYHGHSDVVLARAASQGGGSLPVAPGVPTGIVGDVVVLPYGDQSSIDFIRKNGDTLAAVLVEPVQSRYPEHQPVEFLREIRKLTEKSGTPFIFDEVICGLRVAPAGAEQLFQIKPDISVYGKILGGGMPIGAVAGFSKYLDPIDGGYWSFGDDSYPGAEMTFFAGTFCKHPITMAAADAVLDRFLQEGEALTKNLNARTSALCDRINKEFQGYDLQANNFGSLFRFKSQSNIDLLFANINYRGAYVWEGRNLFLSTAHTPKDEDDFLQIIRGSMDELSSEGFLRKKP